MKSMLLSSALAACLALPAFAQTAATSPFQAEVVEQSVTASDMIGARIYVSEAEVDADAYEGVQTGWNDIGEVNDILLGRDGKVDAVLVDIGGFLGIGERQVAVDMDALRFVQDSATDADADDWFLVMRGDRALIESAPEYRRAAVVTDAEVEAQAEAPAAPEADVEAAPATTADGTASDGTAPRYDLPEGYAMVEPSVLTAEMLTGANVYGPNNNDIATIADLVLTPEGKVSQVVMDVGGFLGMGEHRVALPMERINVAQRDGGDIRVYTDMTEDELKALPKFEI